MPRSPFPGICALRRASGVEKLNRSVAASPLEESGLRPEADEALSDIQVDPLFYSPPFRGSGWSENTLPKFRLPPLKGEGWVGSTC